jgi:hypothetical protein
MLLEPVPRERPTLTIIIPVYENYGKIHNLLASINFRYRTIFNFEILVIDETNDDRFRDYMVE